MPVVKNYQENPTGGKQKLFFEYDSFGPVPKLTERNFRIQGVPESFDLAEQWAIQAGGTKVMEQTEVIGREEICFVYPCDFGGGGGGPLFAVESSHSSLCFKVGILLAGDIFLFFFFIQLSNHFGGDAPVDDVIGLDAAGFLLGTPQRRLDKIHDSSRPSSCRCRERI